MTQTASSRGTLCAALKVPAPCLLLYGWQNWRWIEVLVNAAKELKDFSCVVVLPVVSRFVSLRAQFFILGFVRRDNGEGNSLKRLARLKYRGLE